MAVFDKSNIRPIAIFSGYMITAALLTFQSIHIISHQSQRRRRTPSLSSAPKLPILLFATLAVASLCTTWYYMLAFFGHSYHEWAAIHAVPADSSLQLALWLKNTQLFKQAWGTAMATDERFWWTQQIFGFATVWSLVLGPEGSKRQVPRMWIFMLLGQIVAISFAVNLSFLALLMSSPVQTPKQVERNTRGREEVRTWEWGLTAIVVFSFSCVWMIPYLRGHPLSMVVLLAPHMTLFVPLIGIDVSAFPSHQRRWTSACSVAVLLATLLHVRTTLAVYVNGKGVGHILHAFYQHPAVSSVGSDVVMCWITFGAWYLVGASQG